MSARNEKPQENAITAGDLLTVGEAASFLRLKPSTVRAWVLRRRIQFVKLGGKRIFFRRGDLDKFIAASVIPRVVE